MSSLDLRRHIRDGDGVWWGQAGAEATPLVDALLDQVAEIGSIRAFTGLSLNRRLRDLPTELRLVSYGAMGELRAVAAQGRLDVVPAHYSVLPRLFAERSLPTDVALVQVSPPGPDGLCSLGIGPDYAGDALPHTRVVVAEVNARMPRTVGTPGIALEDVAEYVETDRALPGLPERTPDDVDNAIAAHVGGLIRDGDTIQIGVGSLPTAILDGLTEHRDLGFHGGMITDAVVRLARAGVLTGRCKEIDAGRIVTGSAIGGPALYDAIPDLPVDFRPASYTHNPRVLGRLGRLVAVNSALSVDLTGQVGSEVSGGRYLGGVGGQADFSGAAARTGALSVIALRSTAGAASTVVPLLPEGIVTTTRADVDAIVTEHGVAMLRGCPIAQRGRRLASIAAPEHRDDLLRFLHDETA